jgi:transposase-like protein
MIQALIPLGLHAVEEALQQEVLALAGRRYAHAVDRPAIARWGSRVGSLFLADQKVPVRVPRVRNRATITEVSLATYAQFQTPRGADVGLFRGVLGGLSCRDYEVAAEAVPEAFGLTKSSVSRRFVRASAKALQRLHERRHDDAEWLVLLLDGKSIADDQVVIALGVTTTGEQRILGLVQTATENKRVIAAFLRELVERGFQAPTGLLVVRDGAKALSAAARGLRRGRPDPARSVAEARERAERVPKPQHALWRRKLQAAYAKATYGEA